MHASPLAHKQAVLSPSKLSPCLFAMEPWVCLKGMWRLGVGKGMGFVSLFVNLRKKNICTHICIYIQTREREKWYVRCRLRCRRQSSSKQPSFLKYWENIQKSRDWYILSLCYSKKWEVKLPPCCPSPILTGRNCWFCLNTILIQHQSLC